MKCRNCGHEIPDGKLYCEFCGVEVQIVPDYNPLEDMLTAQIKVSFDEDGNPKKDTDPRENSVQNTARRSTRALSPEEERKRRRQRAARKKAALRRKRRRLLTIWGSFFF